jgi:peptidoglycan/xylan/chitin deacetylase (PgdA/CDA1 family)
LSLSSAAIPLYDAPAPMTNPIFVFMLALLGCARALEPAEDPSTPPAPDDGVRVSVLGYHEFSDTAPETAMRISTTKFRKQMEVIRQLGITVISLDDFIAWKRGEKEIPEKSILITIDDGWKSTYTDAFPILKEYGYPFTLYLYKNYVDGGGRALTSPMIREMVAAGATIGSHSVSHPLPGTIKAQQAKGPESFDQYLRTEMGESKRFLEARFGVSVTTYAFPGGYFTGEMLELADEFGYTHLFTVQPGKVRRSMPDNTLPRYMILGNHDPIFEFATSFREAGSAAAAPAGAISGLTQTTPHPVSPEAGAIVNSRLPEISVDFSDLPDLDPATIVMKVSGFGEVPVTFDPDTRRASWQTNRRLRQLYCQVLVTWKNTAGSPPEAPLRWSFRLDREAAYLPDGD